MTGSTTPAGQPDRDGSNQADSTEEELLTPQEAGELLAKVRAEIGRVIVGQQRVVERVLVALLAGGHCLLEGAPGLGKTRLLITLATTLGGTFSRVQFTPDLLPSDIVGTRIWRQEEGRFTVELGPVFANFVLTDEINRAPAKVQSALLEVMAERQVSIGGTTYPVDTPFLVLATQNPIESEGVYQLPEAQRDRFLMKVPVDYPAGPHEEMEIVRRAAGDSPEPREVVTLDKVKALQSTTRAIHVDPRVADYAVRLVMATRDPDQHGLEGLAPMIAFGASPRASIGLVEGARALALLRGHGAVEPQDVYDIAYDVLNHRLVMSFDAVADGVTVDEVLYHLLTTVPAPSLHQRGPIYATTPSHSYGAAPAMAGPPRIPDASPVPPSASAGLRSASPYGVASSTTVLGSLGDAPRGNARLGSPGYAGPAGGPPAQATPPTVPLTKPEPAAPSTGPAPAQTGGPDAGEHASEEATTPEPTGDDTGSDDPERESTEERGSRGLLGRLRTPAPSPRRSDDPPLAPPS